MLAYAGVCSRMLTYDDSRTNLQGLDREHALMLTGTQFTCFTSAKVQILTDGAASALSALPSQLPEGRAAVLAFLVL